MSLVLVERDPSPIKLDVIGVEDWPLQKFDPGRFTRSYPETETCYVVSGAALIIPDDNGEPVPLRDGDLLTLLPGLSCTWEVHRALTLHYRAD